MAKIFEGYDWKKTAIKGGSVFVYSGVGAFLVYLTQALAAMPTLSFLEMLIVGVLTGGTVAAQNYLKNKDN